jgi:hypothetical protein
MNEEKTVRWTTGNSVFLVLLLCNLGAITWYLWAVPDQDLEKWKKVASTVGSWVGSVAGFLGIKFVAGKQSVPEMLSPLHVRLAILVLTVCLWLFVLPFHSLSLVVTDLDTGKPLPGVTVTVDQAQGPRPHISDGQGLLRVNALLASPHHLLLARNRYQSSKWDAGFGDVLPWAQTNRVALLPSKGKAHLESTPDGAAIYLDENESQPFGTTPQDLELTAGSHKVSFRKPAMQPTAWEPFIVPEGGEVRFGRTLAALTPAGPAHALDQRKYGVNVFTDPNDADIYVDGRQVGRAPREVRVAGGPHRIEARLPGYSPAAEEFTMPGRTILTLQLRKGNSP